MVPCGLPAAYDRTNGNLGKQYQARLRLQELWAKNGNFDHHSSLLRLFFARNGMLDELRSAASLEKIILRNNQLTSGSKEEVKIHGKRIDYVAQGLLSRLGKNISVVIFSR